MTNPLDIVNSTPSTLFDDGVELSLDYNQLHMIVMSAVQGLIAENASMKARLDALEQK